MYSDITCIILSGGKSSRMGVNKSLLKLGNATLIERTANLMNSIFKEVIIITNSPEEYSFLQIPIYEDVYKGIGPLGGIHAGLIYSKTEMNFIISCDMPLVTKNLIEFIINFNTDKLITITKADGFIQQLCGLYSKKTLTEIVRVIEEDNSTQAEHNHQKKCVCKVLQLVKNLNAEIIDIADKYESYEEGMFLNMNKPEDFEIVKYKLKNMGNNFQL